MHVVCACGVCACGVCMWCALYVCTSVWFAFTEMLLYCLAGLADRHSWRELGEERGKEGGREGREGGEGR